MRWVGPSLLVVVGALAACGDDASPPAAVCTTGTIEACTRDDGTSGERSCGADFRWGPCGAPIPPPDAGLLPTVSRPDFGDDECREGWSPLHASDGPTVCEPWPELGRETCPPHSVHHAGTPGCAVVGSPCPAGDFSVDVPTDRAVAYALAGAAGGDGSASLPFGTITEAVAALPAGGGVVAIGKGTYRENVTSGPSVTLLGACPAETVLTSSAPVAGRVMRPTGTGNEVIDLSVGGGDGIALGTDVGAAVLVRGFWAEGIRSGLIATADSTMTIDDVVLTGIHDLGVQSTIRASVTGNRVSLSEIRGGAFDLVSDASMDLQDVAVTRSSRSDLSHVFRADDAATVQLQGLVVEETTDQLLLALAANVEIDDLIVRAVPDDTTRGLVLFGGTLVVRTGLVDGVAAAPVGLAGAGATASIDRTIVRGGRALGAGGAIEILDGAMFSAVRSAFEDSDGIGILAAHPGTTLVLSNTVVRDTTASRGLLGHGVHVQQGVHASLSEVVIVRSRTAGLVVSGGTTTAELADLVVRSSLPVTCDEEPCAPDEQGGTGIAVIEEGVADVVGFSLEHNHLCGLQLARGGEADASNGVVRGNQFGACVADRKYDLARLQDAVIYLDNDRNLETSVLPVPESFAPSTGG